MRRIGLALLAIVAMLALAVPAGANHFGGCPHRPTIWNGTGADECASDGDGSNDAWSLGGGTDYAHGDGGYDTINGNGGNDNIQGGSGPDFVVGGDGGDRVFENEPSDPGAATNDDVYGDDGNDTLECGRGSDTCRGGNGYDVLFHCHDAGVDDIGGFEEHYDVNIVGC